MTYPKHLFSAHFDNHDLQLMKILRLSKNNKRRYLTQSVCLCVVQHIWARGDFCMNYCSNAVWYGGCPSLFNKATSAHLKCEQI